MLQMISDVYNMVCIRGRRLARLLGSCTLLSLLRSAKILPRIVTVQQLQRTVRRLPSSFVVKSRPMLFIELPVTVWGF